MALDMDRMRRDKDKAESKRGNFEGAEIFKPEEGEYLLYICRPVHEDEQVPYVEFECHFQFGPGEKMITNARELADNPHFLAALEARKHPDDRNEDGSFPDDARMFTLADAEEGWEHAEAFAKRNKKNKRIQLKTRWLFGVVVMAYRKSNRHEWEWVKNPEFQYMNAGATIYNGIMDVIFDEQDITDPDAAVLIHMKKKGSKLNTEYTIKADSETLKKPLRLDEDLYNALEDVLQPGGDGDLHAFIARNCRSKAQIEAIILGTDEEDKDEDDDKSSRGGGRGGSFRSRRGDDEDEPRRGRGSRSRKDDDDEDDEPPRRRSRSRFEEPPEEPPEEEEESEEEESEESEEEEPPPRRGRRSETKDEEPPARRGARRSGGDEDELDAALAGRRRRK